MSASRDSRGVAVDVVAGILEREGRFLIGRRAAEGTLPNLWEFPGGKVEAGETPEQTLEREFREELGVEIDVGEHVGISVHEYPEGRVRLSAYRVCHRSGRLEPRVHGELRWVRLIELKGFAMAPADVPLVRALEEHARP